ncbi:hypothetical protein YC2023_117839 [Brassica napus]
MDIKFGVLMFKEIRERLESLRTMLVSSVEHKPNSFRISPSSFLRRDFAFISKNPYVYLLIGIHERGVTLVLKALWNPFCFVSVSNQCIYEVMDKKPNSFQSIYGQGNLNAKVDRLNYFNIEKLQFADSDSGSLGIHGTPWPYGREKNNHKKAGNLSQKKNPGKNHTKADFFFG